MIIIKNLIMCFLLHYTYYQTYYNAPDLFSLQRITHYTSQTKYIYIYYAVRRKIISVGIVRLLLLFMMYVPVC